MPYTLLEQYKNESNILSRAYKLNEGYHLFVHRCLTYPLIVLSTISSVLAGLRLESLEYVLLGLSLIILILSAFNTAIAPKDKQYNSNKISNEFAEIALNINQFIIENNKKPDEIKIYSQKTLAIFEVWRSVSGEINPKYLAQARLECAVRIARVSLSESKKKETTTLKTISLEI